MSAALYLAPYLAANAAVNALDVSYAAELARFGIETSIVVPGSLTSGTNHFASAGTPADEHRASQYVERYPGLLASVAQRLAWLSPPDLDTSLVSNEIARIVALPAGQRPFRSHVDPANDGSEEVSAVADRVRLEFLTRVELADLLRPAP